MLSKLRILEGMMVKKYIVLIVRIFGFGFKLTYMPKKVVSVVFVREFFIFLPTNDLQHHNTKTKYIRLYRESYVYCILRRNVTTAEMLKEIS